MCRFKWKSKINGYGHLHRKSIHLLSSIHGNDIFITNNEAKIYTFSVRTAQLLTKRQRFNTETTTIIVEHSF